MHFVYKLIALSVVFGLVLTSPTSRIAAERFDQSNDFMDVSKVSDESSMDKSRTLEVVLPGLKLLPLLLSFLPKIVGLLKAKALPVAVVLIKWLAPKTIFLAIGAIATVAICKITGLCSLAYEPQLVYDAVPPQLRNFVSPERLEYAQDLLINALQQYTNQDENSFK